MKVIQVDCFVRISRDRISDWINQNLTVLRLLLIFFFFFFAGERLSLELSQPDMTPLLTSALLEEAAPAIDRSHVRMEIWVYERGYL